MTHDDLMTHVSEIDVTFLSDRLGSGFADYVWDHRNEFMAALHNDFGSVAITMGVEDSKNRSYTERDFLFEVAHRVALSEDDRSLLDCFVEDTIATTLSNMYEESGGDAEYVADEEE